MEIGLSSFMGPFFIDILVIGVYGTLGIHPVEVKPNESQDGIPYEEDDMICFLLGDSH